MKRYYISPISDTMLTDTLMDSFTVSIQDSSDNTVTYSPVRK